MLLHEFTHVDPHHRGIIIEQEPGQRLGQLSLADPGGAQEQEAAERTVRVLQPGARAPHRLGHGNHRVLLADHPFANHLFHVEQLLALTLHHPLNRNPGPLGDDRGDILGGHFFTQQRVF